MTDKEKFSIAFLSGVPVHFLPRTFSFEGDERTSVKLVSDPVGIIKDNGKFFCFTIDPDRYPKMKIPPL
jgi:hypothetical protein